MYGITAFNFNTNQEASTLSKKPESVVKHRSKDSYHSKNVQTLAEKLRSLVSKTKTSS